jgi:uncharacterized protein
VCLLAFSPQVLAQTSNQISQVAQHGVFWKLERGGETAGYLLGTIHSEDPRVLDFSEEFLSKLSSCDVFAMEMVPDLPTLHRLTEYMNYQDGKTLASVIGAERFGLLTEAMSSYRLSADFITHMKPWAAMMTLSSPPPNTGFFMDLSLSLRASGNASEVVGLETLEQQLSFLENMPAAMQISLLDQAIAEVGRVEQLQSKMVDAYLENDLELLRSITDEELQTVGDDVSNYFYQHGIAERNQRMLTALLPMLESSKVFVAVGALHLPARQGLLELLSESGYQLVALPMPFVELPLTEP